MKIRELIERIETDFPHNSSMSFDNSGANIVDYEAEINNILVCLDVTKDSILYANNNDANLIISHHPMIFNQIRNLNDDPTSNRIKLLNKYDISAYSCHTNFDVNIENGMGINVLNKIFDNDEILSHKLLDTYLIDNKTYGLGDIITIKKTYSFNDILKIIIDRLELNESKISYYKCSDEIKKIIILPGSGSSDVELVIKEKPDLFISSDLKHNNILDLCEANISYINATHYGLEKVFIEAFSKYLSEFVSSNKILKYINTNL